METREAPNEHLKAARGHQRPSRKAWETPATFSFKRFGFEEASALRANTFFARENQWRDSPLILFNASLRENRLLAHRLLAHRLLAHRLTTVREADRIYLLADGRVAESGTHDELVAKGGKYAELCAAGIS